MEIAEYKLQKMLTAAAELGAINALKKAGIMQKDELSQREAYRRFGESKVKAWRIQGKLKRIKLGEGNAKVTYSLTELETISYTEKI
ncbi:MAG: hypothetical protein Q8J88_01180 [Bacteroidales bacterium]|nr:hypothetical protein [Bacteroidales bacterium]